MGALASRDPVLSPCPWPAAKLCKALLRQHLIRPQCGDLIRRIAQYILQDIIRILAQARRWFADLTGRLRKYPGYAA